ncbi:eff, partial [Symbiodinium sp. KB8]
MNFGWTESETPKRGLSRLFSRRKPSQGHSGRTPLATLAAPSPSFFGGRRRRTSSVEDGLELDEISDATQRGRPRRRKNLSCLGIFACGSSALPRSGSLEPGDPEQAQAITPAPAPCRGAWSGALPDRKPRGSLVEQLGFKSRVLR